jgi:hypothetical protein
VHSTLGEGSTFTVTLPRPGSASRLVKLVEATGDRRSQA